MLLRTVTQFFQVHPAYNSGNAWLPNTFAAATETVVGLQVRSPQDAETLAAQLATKGIAVPVDLQDIQHDFVAYRKGLLEIIVQHLRSTYPVLAQEDDQRKSA